MIFPFLILSSVEDVLEEALANAVCRRRWVEVVVPAIAPFRKP